MLSAPRTIVPPTAEPVSVEDARKFLRIDDVELDEEIDRYVKGARAQIENLTGTRLCMQTVEIHADSFGDLEHLQVGPVQSIESVEFTDGAGATIAFEDFELFGADLDAGIRPIVGATWPVAASRRCAILVTLVVGYADDDLPDDVSLALFALIRAGFDGVSLAVDHLLINHRINF